MAPEKEKWPVKMPTRFQIKHYDGYEDTHAHDYHQIVIPLRGVMEMDVEGRTERVVKDRAAIIHEGEKHCFIAPEDDSFLIVDIGSKTSTGENAMNRALWNDRQGKSFLQIDPAISHLCDFFTEEIRHDRLQGVQAMMAGDMLIAALEKRLGIDHGPLVRGMDAALGFIESHCHLPITVKQVAVVSGMSVSHFHDRFRKQFATSPKNYILSRRLVKAASLLENTSWSLAQIALEVGYSDQASFSRAFQRKHGLSPAQWRKNNQSSEKRT